jgi:hypothetical protein
MSYNRVKIISIKSGAELGEVVHDQWLELEFEGERLILFDQDAVLPPDCTGKEVGVKISVMPVKVEKSECNKNGFVDKRSFVGKIIEKERGDDSTNYVLDIDGLKVNLSWPDEFDLMSCVKIEGRLDVEKIEGVKDTGWKTIR